ncbi:hypothetical protein MKX03_029168 [Papaver bracteatum]|nr:hypothetical protein MKX03_029168 [Papaver bracteatum]
MAEIHMKHTLSFAVLSIFVFFYVSQIAVAGKLFPGLEMDPIKVGLRKEKFSHFRVYWHDKADGPNPTTIQVAGANSTLNSATGFAQGIYASAGVYEIAVLTNANIVFTTGKYNGSTIGIMGRNTFLSEVREMPIVGGTGLLRFARGYVEARTHHFNITSHEASVEYNIYVYHF